MVIITLSPKELDRKLSYTCFGKFDYFNTKCYQCDINLDCKKYMGIIFSINKATNVKELTIYLVSNIDFIREKSKFMYDYLDGNERG